MFVVLLFGSLVIALVISHVLTRIFKSSISGILSRIISEDISSAWVRYILFAMYVAGVSSGVRIWELERYISPQVIAGKVQEVLTLTGERLLLELYGTLIGTLQGVSGVLLLFFVVALIAYVLMRVVESRRAGPAKP
ncbi:MAG: hypothetical protein Q8P50_05350 [Bacillota bacterium]|nr:hypothetical protein [Bacillota bacterium]